MFVRATYYREKKTVHYFGDDGEETLYIGGSFAWRMNNPGNMAKPSKRVVSNVIGYAQRTSSAKSIFLIFQDKDSGEKAPCQPAEGSVQKGYHRLHDGALCAAERKRYGRLCRFHL